MNSGPPSQFLMDHTLIPGLDGRTDGDSWQWAYSDILSNRKPADFHELEEGTIVNLQEWS